MEQLKSCDVVDSIYIYFDLTVSARLYCDFCMCV